MGLFSKRHLLRDDHYAKLVEVANISWNLFPGSLDGPKLTFTNAEVDLLDGDDRLQLGQHLVQVLEAMDKEQPLDPQLAVMRAQLPSDADRFRIAGVLVAKAFVGLDMLAQAELLFPRDRRVHRLRRQLMSDILTAMDRYYGVDGMALALRELPNLNRLVMGPLAGDWTKDPD